jgi:hypothetical protein
MTALGALGEKVATCLQDDDGKRSAAISQAEQLFVAKALHGSAQSRRPVKAVFFSLAAAFAVAALAWLVVGRPPDRLEFQVDGRAGQAQTWLAAPAARAVVVQFSDGTQLLVDPLSRARVVDTGRNGASIALENGSLSAHVVHTQHSAWRLIAGPFAVRITGTRFDLGWDSVSQRFSITVREGSVGVAGSIVGAERAVRAGETLVASVAEGRFDLINGSERLALPTDAGGFIPSTDGSASTDPGAASGNVPAPPEPVAPETRGKDASGGWRELAKRGDLRRAFAIADGLGFQSICETATPAELLVLGDAARLSGRADRAFEALSTLRRRYPHDPRRAAAAFALGKVAFDQRHAYAQAAEWFSTCVREQPNGPLAREAWGRQIEALRSIGDGAAAKRAAREYLSRYPDGPHADIARAVLK